MDIKKIDIKSVLWFALPFILESGFIQISSLADTVIVAKIGQSAIVSVGVMVIILKLIYIFPQQIGTAAQIIVSRLKKQTKEKIDEIMSNSIYLSLFVSFICAFFVYIFKNQIATVMNLKAEAFTYGVDYLSIRLIGLFAFALSIIYMRILKAEGLAKQVLKGRCFYTVAIVITDIIALNMGYGVRGIAYATVLCEILEMFYYMYIAKTDFTAVNTKLIKEIWKIYTKCATGIFAQRFGVVVFTAIVAKLGAELYSIHVMCIQIVYFVTAFSAGFGEGLLVLLGNSISTDNHHLTKRNFYIFIKTDIIMTLILGGFTAVLSYPLLSFMTGGVNLNMALWVMVIYTFEIMFETISNPYENMLNVGKELDFTKKVNIISIFFIRNMFLLPFLYFGWHIYGVALAVAGDYLVRTIIYSFKVHKDFKWIHFDIKNVMNDKTEKEVLL